jgi:hypothetical protein
VGTVLWLVALAVVGAEPATIYVSPSESIDTFDGQVFAANLAAAIELRTGRVVRLGSRPDSLRHATQVGLTLVSGVHLCRLVAERTVGSAEPLISRELITEGCSELRVDGLDYPAFARVLFPEEPTKERATNVAVVEPQASPNRRCLILAGVGAALTVAGLTSVLVGTGAVDDPPDPFEYEDQRSSQRILYGVGGAVAGTGLVMAGLAGLLALLD